MRAIAVAMSIVALLVSGAAARAGEFDESIDILIKFYGITGLTNQQQAATRSLVFDLVNQKTHAPNLDGSASAYIKAIGYEPVNLEIISGEDGPHLLANMNGAVVETANIPFDLDAVTFKSGEYYCKSGFGGISSIITPSGHVIELSFATWKRVR